MPRVLMCADDECPSRFTCYRFSGKPFPNHGQYHDFERTETADSCEDFWPVEKPPR